MRIANHEQPSFYIHRNQLQDQYAAESKHQDLPQPLLILTLQDGWTIMLGRSETHEIILPFTRSVYIYICFLSLPKYLFLFFIQDILKPRWLDMIRQCIGYNDMTTLTNLCQLLTTWEYYTTIHHQTFWTWNIDGWLEVPSHLFLALNKLQTRRAQQMNINPCQCSCVIMPYLNVPKPFYMVYINK